MSKQNEVILKSDSVRRASRKPHNMLCRQAFSNEGLLSNHQEKSVLGVESFQKFRRINYEHFTK